MNNKSCPEQIVLTVGEKLRKSRELLGLSQQAVADQLNLKISIIKGIEQNYMDLSIAWIFLYGYICSYARLVDIPDKEILSILEKPQSISNVESTTLNESFLKKMKIRKNLLFVGLSFLLLLIIIMFLVFCCLL